MMNPLDRNWERSNSTRLLLKVATTIRGGLRTSSRRFALYRVIVFIFGRFGNKNAITVNMSYIVRLDAYKGDAT
uniref:Bestrophin homolog n=1 Tax=Panagrellus redivivus TaxID=6233 RepID=A0A7E4ZTD5_PANRE